MLFISLPLNATPQQPSHRTIQSQIMWITLLLSFASAQSDQQRHLLSQSTRTFLCTTSACGSAAFQKENKEFSHNTQEATQASQLHSSEAHSRSKNWVELKSTSNSQTWKIQMLWRTIMTIGLSSGVTLVHVDGLEFFRSRESLHS